MALGVKLELRQSQSLVMTPQLQQAIKLLQLSNIELNAFVEEELERNPILERHDETHHTQSQPETVDRDSLASSTDAALPEDGWSDEASAVTERVADLDTDYANVDPDASAADRQQGAGESPRDDWSSVGNGASIAGENYNLEAFVSESMSLQDYLNEQLRLAGLDAIEQMIAAHLIDWVDEAGYMRGDTYDIAEKLGVEPARVEAVLATLQGFEPAGIFARDLGECLALQLRERNRYDPMIEQLLANLDLLASHNLPALRQACGVAKSELAEMILEIRELDPKPGLRYGSIDVQPVVPDVIVRHRTDGSWHVELNSETLPRVLVNQSYYATVAKSVTGPRDKEYLSGCLQTANWLTKSLDQRARTILKVASEIVRQQDAFF
ncbi:MAG: RNA polymerase sigma-54 factor, partial [Pseudomonadota bacterium]